MGLQRSHKPRQAQVEGPNWIFIVGGALLSTISIKFGCLLIQAFDTKQSKNGKSMGKRMPEVCQFHSNLYRFGQGEVGCYHCHSGMAYHRVDFKQTPTSPASKEDDPDLSLVAVSVMDSTKDKDALIWPSSPEHLELPRKPFNQSSSSESPSFSEYGSDIFSKPEVIQKLREQLKRRDDMTLELQDQIAAIQCLLNVQMAQSAHLQSQLDGANWCLFDSEMEIRRLRKAIADHCAADARPLIQNQHATGQANGYANGYVSSADGLELNCVRPDKQRDSDRVEMLKQEVGELREVIEGKEFLLQSYREQKVELCTKVKELELQMWLSSQVPNIL